MADFTIQEFNITWELPSGQQVPTRYAYDPNRTHGYTLDEYRLKVIESCQSYGFRCVECDSPNPKFRRL